MARQARFLGFSAVMVTLIFLHISQVSGIIGGSQSLRGEWPFVAALYHSGEYICGATLISNKHVLTAALCIQGKFSSERILPNDAVVRLGAYNLTANDEEGTLERNVSEIHVHPDWHVRRADVDANLAILVLSDKVAFSNYIRAVSLVADEDDVIVNYTINANCTIVGWGANENISMEVIPRKAFVQGINDSICFRRYQYFVDYTPERIFCCGNGNGVPNRGDAGGGLFVDSGSGWVQYGIVSGVIAGKNFFDVTLNSISVYTNLKLFKTWIEEIIIKN